MAQIEEGSGGGRSEPRDEPENLTQQQAVPAGEVLSADALRGLQRGGLVETPIEAIDIPVAPTAPVAPPPPAPTALRQNPLLPQQTSGTPLGTPQTVRNVLGPGGDVGQKFEQVGLGTEQAQALGRAVRVLPRVAFGDEATFNGWLTTTQRIAQQAGRDPNDPLVGIAAALTLEERTPEAFMVSVRDIVRIAGSGLGLGAVADLVPPDAVVGERTVSEVLFDPLNLVGTGFEGAVARALTKGAKAAARTAWYAPEAIERAVVGRTAPRYGAGFFANQPPAAVTEAYTAERARTLLNLPPNARSPRGVMADLRALANDNDTTALRQNLFGPGAGITRTNMPSGKGLAQQTIEGTNLPRSGGTAAAATPELEAYRVANVARYRAIAKEHDDALARIEEIERSPVLSWANKTPEEQIIHMVVNDPDGAWEPYLEALRNAIRSGDEAGEATVVEAARQHARDMEKLGRIPIAEPLVPGAGYDRATELREEQATLAARARELYDQGVKLLEGAQRVEAIPTPYKVRRVSSHRSVVVGPDGAVIGRGRGHRAAALTASEMNRAAAARATDEAVPFLNAEELSQRIGAPDTVAQQAQRAELEKGIAQREVAGPAGTKQQVIPGTPEAQAPAAATPDLVLSPQDVPLERAGMQQGLPLGAAPTVEQASDLFKQAAGMTDEAVVAAKGPRFEIRDGRVWDNAKGDYNPLALKGLKGSVYSKVEPERISRKAQRLLDYWNKRANEGTFFEFLDEAPPPGSVVAPEARVAKEGEEIVPAGAAPPGEPPRPPAPPDSAAPLPEPEPRQPLPAPLTEAERATNEAVTEMERLNDARIRAEAEAETLDLRPAIDDAPEVARFQKAHPVKARQGDLFTAASSADVGEAGAAFVKAMARAAGSGIHGGLRLAKVGSTAGDVGSMARQLGYGLLKHPRVWANTWKVAGETILRPDVVTARVNQMAVELAERGMMRKLHWRNADEFAGEAVRPVGENIPVAGEVIRRSNALFNNTINYFNARVMLDTANRMEKVAAKAASEGRPLRRNEMWNDQIADDLAETLNFNSGRGYDAAAIEARGGWAYALHKTASLLWSPQWQASRFRIMGDMAKALKNSKGGALLGQGTVAENEAVWSGVLFAAGNVALLAGTANRLGLEIEFDAHSTNFARMPLGEPGDPKVAALGPLLSAVGVSVQTYNGTTYADFTSAIGADIRLIAQLLPIGGDRGFFDSPIGSGRAITSSGRESDPWNPRGGRSAGEIILNFLGGRSGPGGRIAQDILTPFDEKEGLGSRMIGAVIGAYTPMLIQDSLETSGITADTNVETFMEELLASGPWFAAPTPPPTPTPRPRPTIRPATGAPASGATGGSLRQRYGTP